MTLLTFANKSIEEVLQTSSIATTIAQNPLFTLLIFSSPQDQGLSYGEIAR